MAERKDESHPQKNAGHRTLKRAKKMLLNLFDAGVREGDNRLSIQFTMGFPKRLGTILERIVDAGVGARQSEARYVCQIRFSKRSMSPSRETR